MRNLGWMNTARAALSEATWAARRASAAAPETPPTLASPAGLQGAQRQGPRTPSQRWTPQLTRLRYIRHDASLQRAWSSLEDERAWKRNQESNSPISRMDGSGSGTVTPGVCRQNRPSSLGASTADPVLPSDSQWGAVASQSVSFRWLYADV